MKSSKKILFVTGTRADYAKIRPIFKYFYDNTRCDINIYITGMHLMSELGNTGKYIEKDIKKYFSSIQINECKEKICYQNSMINNFSKMCIDFEKIIKDDCFDMIFVHGDRLEALASSIVASVNNVPVCHIEAGEVSGSIDESIRHSITKFSHKFLVNDKIAYNRVVQLGESKENIYILGPTSVQNEADFKNENNIFEKYNIIPKEYAVLIYHPVTTLKMNDNKENILKIMKQLECSNEKYIVIYPNSDKYSNEIISVYEQFLNNKRFEFFKSIPYDEFKIVLKNSRYLIGNSSCGLKEAPYYNIATIDIGSRQANRIRHHNFSSIYHIENISSIIKIINKINITNIDNQIDYQYLKEVFFVQMKEISKDTSNFWNITTQKEFNDIGDIIKNVF